MGRFLILFFSSILFAFSISAQEVPEGYPTSASVEILTNGPCNSDFSNTPCMGSDGVPVIRKSPLPDKPKAQERIQPQFTIKLTGFKTPRETYKLMPNGKWKCSTNERNGLPWNWLRSNMCDAEYQEWVKPRLNDRWFKDKIWWTGEVAILIPIGLDAYTTYDFRQYGIIEQNPFLGPRPSDAKVIGFALINAGAQTTYHWIAYRLSHKDPSKPWRIFGQVGIPISVWATSGRAAINNFGLIHDAQDRQIHKKGCQALGIAHGC